MNVWLLRLIRWAGWAALAGTVGVSIGWLAYEAAQGPVGRQAFWPAGRLWRCLGHSIVVAGGATSMALLVAILPGAGLSIARGGVWRRLLTGLTVVPLLMMPSVFGYAWLLLCTSRSEAIRRLMDAGGFNAADAGSRNTMMALAAWLWPIFALTLAACFRRLGREAYQLASLDAGPLRAFVRGVLPALAAPMIAAAAATFLLALTDATIAPLVGAAELWGPEVMAMAAVAGRHDRSAAYVFWAAWPVVVLTAAACLAAWPGVRRLIQLAGDVPTGDTGSRVARSAWLGPAGAVVAGALAMGPLVVFAVELASGRSGAGRAIAVAWQTLGGSAGASLLVAAIAGVLGAAMAAACLHERDWPAWRRNLARGAMGASLVAAILPPELVGATLVRFYSWAADPRTWGGAAGWNLYDDTPWVWTAAVLCRFSFIAVFVTWFVARRQGDDLDAQARSEGAGRLARLCAARLPSLSGALAAMGLVVAGLGLSEISTSVLTQPVRFFGGSLAVAVDMQMHYGRQDETIAAGLMLVLPAVLIALAMPCVRRKNGH